MFISYAQNFEDVILWRALKGVENGFYVDIGAQDPIVDSVSLAFYERGWKGVHVEPSSGYAEALRKARPDEVTIEAVVRDEQGDVQFYEVDGTGLSTVNLDIAERHAAAGWKMDPKLVSGIRLASIFDMHRDREIHWLKIDVEGEELSVLQSWQPSPARPWIVVIECVDPLSREDVSAAWEPELVALGYQFAHADGLNRFYVSEAHPELAKALEHGPNVFDEFALSGTSSSSFGSILTTRQASISGQLVASAAREANLQDLVSSLRSDIVEADSNRVAREASLKAQLELHLNEQARLRRVVLEQGRWRDLTAYEIGVLKKQIHDLQRSTSWRVTGPFRWIASLGRKCLALLLRVSAALARRTAVLLRSGSPRLFNALLKLQILRRVYRAIVKQPAGVSSVSTAAPREPGPVVASTNPVPHIDVALSSYTQSSIVSAMVRWTGGKRLDA